MALIDIDRDAVEDAIHECHDMGRKAFRQKYRFKASTKFELLFEGERYDSKAILAVAHRHINGGDGLPLTFDKLSGGVASAATAATILTGLGFDIVEKGSDEPKRPDWTFDEHVLAFEVYLAHRETTHGPKSPWVIELSDILKRLDALKGEPRPADFRNTDGVSMKLLNLRRFDPIYLAKGVVGLPNGSKYEEMVWDQFGEDLDGLKSAANAIKLSLVALETGSEPPAHIDDDEGASEGGTVMRLHKTFERDRAIIRKKKKTASALVCEVCDFDFEDRYGEVGRNFIEVHHRNPVSLMKPGQTTKLADLALVCANCHRMLHRKRLTMTVDELRATISSD